MKDLYFIRHGESVANIGGTPMIDSRIPLTNLGKEQAQNLLHKWNKNNFVTPKVIYHSEFLRAKQTAYEFIEQLTTLKNFDEENIYTLPLLNEFSYLSFDKIKNLDVQERTKLANYYWNNADVIYKNDNAESFNDFLSRVNTLINQLDTFENNSLFFGHGIWISLLIWRLLGYDVIGNDDIQKFRNFQKSIQLHNTVVYKLTINDSIKQIKMLM